SSLTSIISTTKVKLRPANGWLKSTVTHSSSTLLITPGNSALAASVNCMTTPGASSSSGGNSSRRKCKIFSGLTSPNPCSGPIDTLRLSPAFKPNKERSKPSGKDSSPQTKVAGSPSNVESTSSPDSSN